MAESKPISLHMSFPGKIPKDIFRDILGMGQPFCSMKPERSLSQKRSQEHLYNGAFMGYIPDFCSYNQEEGLQDTIKHTQMMYMVICVLIDEYLATFLSSPGITFDNELLATPLSVFIEKLEKTVFPDDSRFKFLGLMLAEYREFKTLLKTHNVENGREIFDLNYLNGSFFYDVSLDDDTVGSALVKAIANRVATFYPTNSDIDPVVESVIGDLFEALNNIVYAKAGRPSFFNGESPEDFPTPSAEATAEMLAVRKKIMADFPEIVRLLRVFDQLLGSNGSRVVTQITPLSQKGVSVDLINEIATLRTFFI